MITITEAVGNFLEVTWCDVLLLGLPKESNSLKKLEPIHAALNRVFESVRRDRPDVSLGESWEGMPQMQSLMNEAVFSLSLSCIQAPIRRLCVAALACIEFPDELVGEPFAWQSCL